jgi:hypothetical protein
VFPSKLTHAPSLSASIGQLSVVAGGDGHEDEDGGDGGEPWPRTGGKVNGGFLTYGGKLTGGILNGGFLTKGGKPTGGILNGGFFTKGGKLKGGNLIGGLLVIGGTATGGKVTGGLLMIGGSMGIPTTGVGEEGDFGEGGGVFLGQ